MEGMPDWSSYGVQALVWIVALVNILKDTYGLDSKYAFPVATAFGAAYGTALYFASIYGTVEVVLNIVMGSILLGLAASGYYSGVKAHIERNNGS